MLGNRNNAIKARRWPRLPLALVLLASTTGWAQDPSQPYQSAKRPKALMMSGCSSQVAEFPRRAIAYALATVNIPVTFIEDNQNNKNINAETLSQFNLLIISGSLSLSLEQQTAIAAFVENGGGYMALHNASAGPRGGPYEKLLGGRFLKHPTPYRFTVRVTEAGKKHPITLGVRDFEVYDEHHFVTYDVDPQPPGHGPAGQFESSFWTRGPHVLITTDATDNSLDPDRALYGEFGKNGTSIVGGWWREIGKGRVVFFTPGHILEVMNHPMMQRLYQNAAKWLVRLD